MSIGYKPYLMLLTVFVGSAFIFSFVSLLHPQTGQHLAEYSLNNLVKEVIGHFVFGFLGAVTLTQLNLAALAGSMAVLIDVDHLPDVLGLQGSGRPDHSLMFAALASVVLFSAGTRSGMSKLSRLKLIALGPIVLLTHLSYDVFASFYIDPGPGNQFPLFLPFTFSSVILPAWSWLPLELGALLFGFIILALEKNIVNN